MGWRGSGREASFRIARRSDLSLFARPSKQLLKRFAYAETSADDQPIYFDKLRQITYPQMADIPTLVPDHVAMPPKAQSMRAAL